MVINKKQNVMFPEISIEVSGPEGNAYCIVAIISNNLKSIGWSQSDIDDVVAEMTKGDYIHLLHVAKKFIILNDIRGLYSDEFEGEE